MWFGLLHLRPEDGDDVESEQAIVVAYEEHRLFRVGVMLPQLPQCVAFLRAASDGGRLVLPPRCGCCDAPLEVPRCDEEDEVECASA